MIVLKDIKSEELEALLDYMYIGEVNVRQCDLASLISAAECLQVKGLAVSDDEFPARKAQEDLREEAYSHSLPVRRKRSNDFDDQEIETNIKKPHTRPSCPQEMIRMSPATSSSSPSIPLHSKNTPHVQQQSGSVLNCKSLSMNDDCRISKIDEVHTKQSEQNIENNCSAGSAIVDSNIIDIKEEPIKVEDADDGGSCSGGDSTATDLKIPRDLVRITVSSDISPTRF